MPTYTPNFNLIKPSQTDFYNIDQFNQNNDIIDTELHQMKNKFPSRFPIRLLTDNWINVDDMWCNSYTEFKFVSNFVKIISPSPESLQEYCRCGAALYSITNNIALFKAKIKPKTDLIVYVMQMDSTDLSSQA